MYEDNFHLGIKAIIRNKEGKILLLKVNTEQLTGYDGEAYWDIPGGRIHKDSTVEETLLREVEEETGITSIKKSIPFKMVLSNIRIPIDQSSVGLILSSYICDIEDFNSIELSKEHIDYDWFSPKEAMKLLSFKYPSEFVNKLSELE